MAKEGFEGLGVEGQVVSPGNWQHCNNFASAHRRGRREGLQIWPVHASSWDFGARVGFGLWIWEGPRICRESS